MIRSAGFLRGYHRLPHELLNRSFAWLMRAQRPRWLVEAAIARWIARDHIDMSHFDVRPFASLEDFFLRDLRPGARPLAPGLVAPVDGRIVALGSFAASAQLEVKGHVLSLERIVNGADVSASVPAHALRPGRQPLSLEPFLGGSYISIFLSPRGYHHVHMPLDGELYDARWLAGRYFPQNETALRHIPGVYEQNERLVLRLRVEPAVEARDSGREPSGVGAAEILLVMVGASLIGGIELACVARQAFTRPEPVLLRERLPKGARLGHFRFGSTVILVMPPGFRTRRVVGEDVLLGEPLFE